MCTTFAGRSMLMQMVCVCAISAKWNIFGGSTNLAAHVDLGHIQEMFGTVSEKKREFVLTMTRVRCM